MILDLCEDASANETNGKEAARSLRHQFKYGEPAAQLAAARLWAIMLRNSSKPFISQCTSRKFLDAVESLLTSSHTLPVVRERFMDVLAAAAYASESGKDAGFRGLWRRVKPEGKPEEGIPFDTDDPMFDPPLSQGRSDALPPTAPSILPASDAQPPDDNQVTGVHSLSPEDVRRMLQECKIGVENANLLRQALALVTPESLNNSFIEQPHRHCVESQERLFTLIPWATAGADSERGRVAGEQTCAELLAEMRDANETIFEALRVYDDLRLVSEERRGPETREDSQQVNHDQNEFMEDAELHRDSDGQKAAGAGRASPVHLPQPPATATENLPEMTPSDPLTVRQHQILPLSPGLSPGVLYGPRSRLPRLSQTAPQLPQCPPSDAPDINHDPDATLVDIPPGGGDFIQPKSFQYKARARALYTVPSQRG
ncbi:hypothetical protein B0H11DRAFT_2400740, partial [Mycena galericulata]